MIGRVDREPVSGGIKLSTGFPSISITVSSFFLTELCLSLKVFQYLGAVRYLGQGADITRKLNNSM